MSHGNFSEDVNNSQTHANTSITLREPNLNPLAVPYFPINSQAPHNGVSKISMTSNVSMASVSNVSMASVSNVSMASVSNVSMASVSNIYQWRQ